MDMTTLPFPPQALIGPAAGLTVFLVVLALFWNRLFQRKLDARMSQILDGSRPARRADKPVISRVSLHTEPKRIFRVVADFFNLAKKANDPELMRMLAQAGFRGEAPALTFLAARLLAPVALLIAAIIYVFAILQLQLPAITQAAIALVIGALGYYVPPLVVKNRIIKRKKSIKRAWPEALDLMLICVESGMSIEAAFRKVAHEIAETSPELSVELTILTAELNYLQERRVAYQNLAMRTDLDEVRATVTSMIQAEHYGTPMGQSLRVLSRENRDARMSEAEKMAASLPPKLTVPMIAFFLPVLFAVIITPSVIQIMALQ